MPDELEERLPPYEVEETGFDPSNTGGGLELAGLLNRLRRPACRGSAVRATLSLGRAVCLPG